MGGARAVGRRGTNLLVGVALHAVLGDLVDLRALGDGLQHGALEALLADVVEGFGVGRSESQRGPLERGGETRHRALIHCSLVAPTPSSPSHPATVVLCCDWLDCYRLV